MITLDVDYIFEVAGGIKALRELLAKQGKPPTYDRVAMWRHRRMISRIWIPPVLYALLREGHDLANFLTDDSLP